MIYENNFKYWIFDLDNTIYDIKLGLFKKISERITNFIVSKYSLDMDEAKKIQKKYYLEYGLTLRGLILEKNLNPEELLQYALDQMMKKNYNKSKVILENFLINNKENPLSGSAHFWLGKIYLFETNYRKAAIVFGEGVQKFPKSIKAAEMYYELAKSLKEMNKTQESCKTLALLEKNYKGNKFTKDPEKIKEKLNCQISN